MKVSIKKSSGDYMKKLINQLFKFGIVGFIAFLIDYSILYILTDLVGINYLISSTISFVVSLTFNYVASIKFVFDVRHKQTTNDIILFVVLSVIGLGINEFIMYIGVDKLYINHKIVKIGATAIVMVYNFITRKIFIEKK